MTYNCLSMPERGQFAILAASLAVAFGLSVASVPAAAQPKAQETVVRLNGSYTFGAKAALELATAWARLWTWSFL